MKDKYVKFIEPFEFCQIPKFNGTSGNVTIGPDNVGIYNPETTMYEFEETEGVMLQETWRKSEHLAGGKSKKCMIKPTIFSDLLLPLRDRKVKFFDSICDDYADEEDKKLWERFEIRLFTAKSQIDIDVAKLYFNAGQVDRLSIKATMLQWKEKSAIE
jgi:hypothetical protein